MKPPLTPFIGQTPTGAITAVARAARTARVTRFHGQRRTGVERRGECGLGVDVVEVAAVEQVSQHCDLRGGSCAAHRGRGAAGTLIVMPVLSWIERRTGRELGSASVVADSKQTLLCTYLSAVLLAGLVLNALLGWSWADPVAALVIAGFAVREGVEAWRGESCCPPPTALLTSDSGTATGALPGLRSAALTTAADPPCSTRTSRMPGRRRGWSLVTGGED